MYTIGRTAKKAGLSRTTLIYYDSIGLLHPTAKSENGYRFYDDAAVERLRIINVLRSAGLRLNEIKRILNSGNDDDSIVILLKRLGTVNHEISTLQKQQEVIISLLKKNGHLFSKNEKGGMDFFRLLGKAGIKPDDFVKWHLLFEEYSQKNHRRFLESAGFNDSEIEKTIEKMKKSR